MICVRCGAHVTSNDKFCGDCGTPLPWQCATCNKGNLAEKRFCTDCGAPRGAKAQAIQLFATTEPSVERRLLSVMFVDLVGSTEISQRLDPEDLRKVVREFHAVVKGLLNRFEGFIAQYLGDGVLVYFGYPQAHEADVERAIGAGLTIVDAVGALSTLAGPKGTLKVRIGIDTGLVVVGDLIGSGASLDTAVTGATPNRAARLQMAAEPGSVVISESTRLLVGSLFEYRELPPLQLKGFHGAERAWTVLKASEIDNRYDALRPGQASLIGRDEELGFLLRHWEQARAGEGQAIVLLGDPGVGKSSLVAALEESLVVSSFQRLQFFCSPHQQDTPLHPFARFLERAADFRPGDSAAEKWRKFSDALPPDTPAEEKALLAELVAIRSSDHNLVDALRPEQRKARTFGAVIGQIERAANQKPTLVIIEDVHWADASTLELIKYLVERVRQHSILVIITARPDARLIFVKQPHVTVQSLGALDHSAAVALIKQIATGYELPEKIIDRIIAHSDSIPLFIEELTKSVIKTVQDDEVGTDGPSLASLPIDAVPTSLHSSLMARLDRLSTGKEVSQIGAVIGREFSFELMLTVSTLPARQLEQCLGELAQAEIIVEHDDAAFHRYTFKHALVRDVAYASLLRERRQVIHRRVAEAMEEEAAGDSSEPQLVAWHFAEAAEPEKAVGYYQKAAESATGRFALAEMVNHLRNGLYQITRLPDSRERDRRELALQLTLGQALIDLEGGNSDGVRVAFERARELCLALDEIKLLPSVYDGLVANYHYARANAEKISHYAEEMGRFGRRTSDPRALLFITRAGCLASFLRGEFGSARQHMEALLNIYEADRDGPQAGMTTRDPRAAMSTFLGICLTILGYPDSGQTKTREGLEYARKLNHPVSLNLGLRRACVQNILQKNALAVIQFSDELATLNTTFQTYQGGWEGTFFDDWAKLTTHMDPVRFGRIEAFLQHLDQANIWAMLPFYMATVADLSAQHGDFPKASVLLRRAREIIDISGSRWCESEITRLEARISARTSTEAVKLLMASLFQAREQGAKLFELRTAIDLAKQLINQKKYAEAQAELGPVFKWFDEGKDLPDYVEARSLLNEIVARQNGANKFTGTGERPSFIA